MVFFSGHITLANVNQLNSIFPRHGRHIMPGKPNEVQLSILYFPFSVLNGSFEWYIVIRCYMKDLYLSTQHHSMVINKSRQFWNTNKCKGCKHILAHNIAIYILTFDIYLSQCNRYHSAPVWIHPTYILRTPWPCLLHCVYCNLITAFYSSYILVKYCTYVQYFRIRQMFWHFFIFCLSNYLSTMPIIWIYFLLLWIFATTSNVVTRWLGLDIFQWLLITKTKIHCNNVLLRAIKNIATSFTIKVWSDACLWCHHMILRTQRNGRHLQETVSKCIFLKERFSNYDFNFIEICSQKCNWGWYFIRLGNSLMPSMPLEPMMPSSLWRMYLS